MFNYLSMRFLYHYMYSHMNEKNENYSPKNGKKKSVWKRIIF